MPSGMPGPQGGSSARNGAIGTSAPPAQAEPRRDQDGPRPFPRREPGRAWAAAIDSNGFVRSASSPPTPPDEPPAARGRVLFTDPEPEPPPTPSRGLFADPEPGPAPQPGPAPPPGRGLFAEPAARPDAEPYRPAPEAYRRPEPEPEPAKYDQPEAYRRPEPEPATYDQPEAYRRPEPEPAAFDQPEAYRRQETEPTPAPYRPEPEPEPAAFHQPEAYRRPEPEPEPTPAPYRPEPEPEPAAFHQPEAYRRQETEPATFHQPAVEDFEPEPAAVLFPEPEPVRQEPATGSLFQPARARPVDFQPANPVEEELLSAASEGNPDRFLSTLLLARVLVPGPVDDPASWPSEDVDGVLHFVTFTSPERLAEHPAAAAATSRPATVRFTHLIHQWPDASLGFAVNPGTPVGATLTGAEVKALANWAAEVGLTGEPDPEPEAAAPAPKRAEPQPQPERVAVNQPLVMQKTVSASQVAYFLDRGYDRISGFVHRAGEVAHLRTPQELYRALGLSYEGSPFHPDDDETFVLRWTAFCPSLYRIPFGGPTEAAMQAMQGWVVERGPFRGNGFAPSETGDVIAEFKVDSTRLPHEAQLWRIGRDGTETLIAMFDADGPKWHRIGDEDA